MKVSAIIPAAGTGKRINAKKQFLEIAGRSMISITVGVFEDCQSIDDVIIVANKEDIELMRDILKGYKKVVKVVVGGAERQDSVYSGLQELSPDTDIVVIHDGARPLVTKDIIANAVTEARVSQAAIVGIPAKDTIKTVSPENIVMETLERSSIWQAQTPQAFKYEVIKEAYERADKIGYKATDDSKLVERLGVSVKMVMGSYENIKITTKEDIAMAEAILKARGL